MRKLGALVIAMISFLSITFGFTFVGLLAGSFIGEEYLGSKEPMIEMLFGGLIGFGMGAGMGVVVSIWLFKRIALTPIDNASRI